MIRWGKSRRGFSSRRAGKFGAMTFSTKSSANTSYTVTRTVLSSVGTPYVVPGAVLSSGGTSYNAI